MSEIKFRKLKIAWTLGCGLMLVMLTMVWVRSYSTWDRCFFSAMNHGWQFNCMLGKVVLVAATPSKSPIPFLCESLPTKDRFQNSFDKYVFGFYFQSTPRRFEIGVPFWFLVAMTLGLASAARMRQFSMGILLVFMSLVAIVLAAALYAMIRASTINTRLRKIMGPSKYQQHLRNDELSNAPQSRTVLCLMVNHSPRRGDWQRSSK